jgi:hypothetical protein
VRAVIPQMTVQQAGMTAISVGHVGIGPIQIGQLALTNFHVGMSSGTVSLQNFRVTLTLHIALDWSVSVQIPFDGSAGWSGTINFGSPSLTIPLGNVTVPGLQNFSIDVSSLSAGPLSATTAPLTNFQLGSAIAEQIRADNTVVPAQGFTIAGLGLTSMRADGVTVPAASIDDVTIGRVHGGALPLGQMTIGSVAMPAAAVSQIASQALDVRATGPGFAFHADAGILDVTLRITPVARGRIDRMTISGLNAQASIGSIELQNVVAPYEMLNIKLSQVGIDQIAIPTLGVS